jgi:hypothetical protein
MKELDDLNENLANAHLSEETPDESTPPNDMTGTTNGSSVKISSDEPTQTEISPKAHDLAEAKDQGSTTESGDALTVPFASLPENVVCNVALKVGRHPWKVRALACWFKRMYRHIA